MVTDGDPPDRGLDSLVETLIDVGQRRSLADGDVVCRERDESDEAYVVISGHLDARVSGHHGTMTVATHGRGAVVGEVTTLIGGRRTATLAAVGATTVGVIDRETLRRVFDEHPDAADIILRAARERTDRSRVAAMLSAELQATDGAVVAAIADKVSWVSIASGQTLFTRGDDADSAYLVISGRLGVTDVEATPRADPGDHHLSTQAPRYVEVGRGGIVGEFGLLEDRVRSATVVALRDTTLARLSAEDFAALSTDHTSLAMGLVRRVLARSGTETAASSPNRSFAMAITADLEAEDHVAIVDTIVDALRSCGSTMPLSATSVDRILRRDGMADTPPGEFGEVRLAELLHQAETEFDHVVLDAGRGIRDGSHAHWVNRTFHHADQVVLLCSPQPDDREAECIDGLLAAVPAGIPRWLALLHPADTERASGGARMRARFGVDEIHHVRRTNAADLGRLARLAAGRGVGLVLSGGGARGHAHIGVYTALVELGVPVDRVIGASMGSIVAGGIGQQLDPPDLLAAMQRGADKLLDYTIPFVSLIKGERIVEVLERQFAGLAIDDMWIPFRCVSTDLTTARIVVHRDGPAARAIRTSVAIPGILPPVAHEGHLLADGGILDNLPAGVFGRDPSIGVIVASDVAPPLGPMAKGDHGLSVSGWTVAGARFVPHSARRAVRRAIRRGPTAEISPTPYPGIGSTLLRSLLIGSSRSRDEHLAAGIIDLYLELDVRTIPLLDFGLVAPAAEAGRSQAHAPISEWLTARGGTPWGSPARVAPSSFDVRAEGRPPCS